MISDASILSAWYDFASWGLDRAESFPKNARFTYADRLVRLCLDIEDRIVEDDWGLPGTQGT
jgi:hypothetical protein